MAFGALMGVLAGGFGLGLMIPPAQRAIGQVANTAMPNEVLAFAEAVELRKRELMTQEEFKAELEKQGLDTTHQDWLRFLGQPLLNIIEVINLERRGGIEKELMYKTAWKLGWNKEGVDFMRRLTEAIPGATDIIAFAVREVYTPEIAEAFGQYEGLDDVFDKAEKDITAIGMSKDTFGKYWAAHWMLPAVNQGFEMLHRGIIPEIATPTEPLSLERLLVALDIMPAWRDKLTAISYSPFTRVDVRRMHKIGVLSDEELDKAYMDLGYDEEKAGKMAEFTILYNYRPPAEEETEQDKDKVKERDLTKTDVLNGYRDELLLEDEVRVALEALGYDTKEVDYYIAKVNYSKDKDETDSYLRYYHDAYVRGVLSHDELVDKLNALNLSGKRVNYLFKVWDLERMARTTKPTKAELMTFLRKKIIDKPVFIEEMKGQGYPERYIGWYLRTV